MLIVETIQNEFINIAVLKVFTLNDRALIVKDSPKYSCYTLTVESAEKLRNYLDKEKEREKENV